MFSGEAASGGAGFAGYLSILVWGNCFGGSVPWIGLRKRAELFLMLSTDIFRLDCPMMPWFVSFWEAGLRGAFVLGPRE